MNIGQEVISTEGIFTVSTIGSAKFTYGRQLKTDGITSATLEISLPKNAVVRKYDVMVSARRADATAVQNVAQVRTQDSTLGTGIIVDFGTPRTVSAVSVPAPLQIVTIKTWMGTGFAEKP